MESYLDERERWEALLRWLRDNGPSIVAGVVIAVAGFTAYRWWQGRVDQRAIGAAALYSQMEAAFAQGDDTRAFAAVGEIERNYASTPYADQARLASAASFVNAGQLERAAAELRVVMSNPHDDILGLIARLRLARVQIAENQGQAALATLNGANPGSFAPRYDQVRGDAYRALGNRPAALAQYRLAQATDPGGETDASLLKLEISELSASAPVPKAVAPSVPAPAATAQ